LIVLHNCTIVADREETYFSGHIPVGSTSQQPYFDR
jgi:hypothetical protein